MKKSIIHEKIFNGSQSVNYTGLWKISESGQTQKLRVLIKRDSYDSQSYAKVQLWDGSQWNFVTSLDWDKSKSKGIFNYDNVSEFEVTRRNGLDARELLNKDAQQLIDLAAEIIY